MQWSVNIGILIEDFGAMLCVIGTVCLLIYSRQDEVRTKYYKDLIRLLALAVPALLLDALMMIIDGRPGIGIRIMLQVSQYGICMINMLLQNLLLRHIVHESGERRIHTADRLIIRLSYLAYLVIVVFNAITGSCFALDVQNVYHTGQLLYILYIPCIVLQVWMGIRLIQWQKEMDITTSCFCWSYVVLPVLGVLFKIVLPGYPCLQIIIMLIAVILFFRVQHQVADVMYRQALELQQQEQRTLLAQLQPHFMYNALLAIMGIPGNPDETIEAISSFAKYLRGNLNSLTNSGTIPARQELDHVNAYVRLEQLRYEGKLDVHIHVTETDFELPPLTLQMLVENSIRHGFQDMKEPGRVMVSSRLLEDWYMITVEDNGCGFDVDSVMKAPEGHVGLQSVRRRVEELCGGRLVITSNPGGTRASVMIPRNKGKVCETR